MENMPQQNTQWRKVPLGIKVIFVFLIIVTAIPVLNFIEILFDWTHYSITSLIGIIFPLLNIFAIVGIYKRKWFKFILSVFGFYTVVMVLMVLSALLDLIKPQNSGLFGGVGFTIVSLLVVFIGCVLSSVFFFIVRKNKDYFLSQS